MMTPYQFTITTPYQFKVMRYFSRNIAKRKRLFAVCNSRCGDESVYFESAGNTRNNYRSNLAQDVQPELKRGSIYVHWPYCSQLCTYCNFNKYVRSNVDVESMTETLVREVKGMLRLSGMDQVMSIYFGGGTPSLATPEVIESVLNAISLNAVVNPNIEVTLEANPSSVDRDKLSAFKAAGVNRLSLGVQSLIDQDLALLNRDHNSLQAISALKEANNVYGGRVNVDLIFGRPNQSLDTWVAEIHEVAELSCNHMSVYQLTVERGTKLSKDVNSGKIVLPGSDEMADMYEAAISILQEHHLMRYEISNFSKSGFESCHNLGYWRGLNYIGIGPGAHSRFRHDKKYIKSVNVLDPDSWMKKVKQCGHGIKLVNKISKYERLQEVVATSLRTREGLTNEIWHLFLSVPLQQVFSKNHSMISQCISDGLLTIDERGARATSKGLQVLDALLPHCCECLQSVEPCLTE